MTITEVLEQLRSTKSKNDKMAILVDNKDNLDLQRAFQLAYDPAYNFWIKKIPEFTAKSQPTISSKTAMKLLVDNIVNRVITGDLAKEFISDLLSMCDEPETIANIIKRDLKCGASTTLANKVWPKLILDPPYLGYQLFSIEKIKKFKLPCYSQVKQDGLYCDLFVTSNSLFYRSRSGNELKMRLPEGVETKLMQNFSGYVICCEGLVINDSLPSGVEPREIGNGYLNSDDVDPDCVTIRMWDIVDIETYNKRKGTIKYKDRWEDAISRVKSCVGDKFSRHVSLVESVWCKTTKDIIDHFVLCRKRKLEGTVIKKPALIWKEGKTADGLKLKNEFDFEVKIVGYQAHKEKTGQIGALFVESSDGKVKFKVGTGLSDELRIWYYKNKEQELGSIICVKGNDLTQSESKEEGVWALFLPRFVEKRHDKKVANTYEEIVESMNSIIELLKQI